MITTARQDKNLVHLYLMGWLAKLNACLPSHEDELTLSSHIFKFAHSGVHAGNIVLRCAAKHKWK